MRSVGFLALDREKIGTKLYGYVLAKRYTSCRMGLGSTTTAGNGILRSLPFKILRRVPRSHHLLAMNPIYGNGRILSKIVSRNRTLIKVGAPDGIRQHPTSV